jgi:membrane associated rhomboid family serine protease
MNPQLLNTRLAFVPVLKLAMLFLAAYCFLYWLLCIRFTVINLKEDITHLWMPLALAWICVFFFIRLRIHALKLDKDNGRIRTLYYLVASAVIAVPVMISVHYLDTATGKLTAVKSIREITSKPPTRYYKAGETFFLREYATSESIAHYTGKNNNTLNFDIYITVPVVERSADTLQPTAIYLGVKYHRSTTERLSDPEQEEMYRAFAAETDSDFAVNHSYYEFEYLENMPNSVDRDNFIVAAKKNYFYNEGDAPVILKAINTPFDQRNGNKLWYILVAYLAGFVVWLVMILIPGVHTEKAELLLSGKEGYAKQWNGYRESIKSVAAIPVTTSLIAVNVLVFIIMVFAGLGFIDFSVRDLIQWGACYRPGIQEGEWWRVVASMFLHGGVMHLLMNMAGLAIAGMFVEPILGVKKYLAGYFLTGIAAALVSLWWHEKDIVAVGASGAIFGLYGIILSSLLSKDIDRESRKGMLILLAFTAGYGLLMGFLSQGIDNSAHMGGLVAGFLFGLLVKKKTVVT